MVRVGTLATAKTISGNPYAANTDIVFDTGGNIIQGKISTTLEKYVIKGTAFIFSSEPTFHSYGVVDEGTLTSATPVTVGEIAFSFTNTNISFYTDGSVKSGTLAESVSVTGYQLTGDIAFNTDGTVDLANTAKTPINGGTPVAPVAPAGGETHSVGGVSYTFKTGTINKDGTTTSQTEYYLWLHPLLLAVAHIPLRQIQRSFLMPVVPSYKEKLLLQSTTMS